MVKNSLAMQERQETWGPSLGREYPLEKEITNHSNLLACRNPWTEEHCVLQSTGSQELDVIEATQRGTQPGNTHPFQDWSWV